MMGWDIASGSKITDFEHIFKEPLVFLEAKEKGLFDGHQDIHKSYLF